MSQIVPSDGQPQAQALHHEPPAKNGVVAVSLVMFVAFMVGLSFASVPLYRMFCAATGYAGTPRRASEGSSQVSPEIVTVRFDGSVASNLNWSFEPVEHEIALHVGENRLAFYRAKNLSNQTLTGTATFNVTPENIGAYFTKVQCFCFKEQTLKAGETADLGVSFFIDPAMLKDRDAKDVRSITLSYTLFQTKTPESTQASAPSLPPDNTGKDDRHAGSSG